MPILPGQVADVQLGPDTAVIRLADSIAVEADRVVLATGNEPLVALPDRPSGQNRRDDP